MEDSDLAMEEIDLTLPAFPPAPKRDRGLLHEDQEDSDEWQPESDRAFRASSYPRFRTDRGYMTDYVAEDAGEATLEFGGDESQTVSVTPQEEDSDAGNDVADLPASPYFGQPAYIEQGARLRRARGGSLTDPSMLPPVPQTLNPYDPEPLPPPPAGMATAAAYAAAAQNARQNSESDELFTPIPTAPRKYGSQPVESLGANPAAYAYANARQPYQPYAYPVQSQAFARPAPLSAPGALGAVLHDPYSNSMAGVRIGQDLQQSEYQTYSQNNWPGAVEPPAQYYLPPDVVV